MKVENNRLVLTVPLPWLGLCLFFWGAATAQLTGALSAALIFMLSAKLHSRFAWEVAHFERLADISSIGFVLAGAYLFNQFGLLGIHRLLALFPWLLVPLALAQVFGTRNTVPASALFRTLRRRPAVPAREFDLLPALALSCLLAASTTSWPPIWYAGGVCACLVIFLATNRLPASGSWGWFFAIGLAALAGTLLLRGLETAQVSLNEAMNDLIMALGVEAVDPDFAYTAIGTIGRRKLSDRVIMRIAAPRRIPLPLRLTEARYQDFEHGIWKNAAANSRTLDQNPNTKAWDLEPASGLTRELAVTVEKRGELLTLAVPPGPTRLESPDLLEVRRHPLGTLVGESKPGFFTYTWRYDARTPASAAPTPADLAVPENYQLVIAAIAREAGAVNLAPRARVQRIERFFADDFRYSLVQPGFYPGRLPLTEFLTRHRYGHCEYFASATTLLLREVGLPARYVVGYLVDEYSPLEGAFIARARHAHAWVEVYVDDRWQVVDTTPALWLTAEAGRASDWQILGDAWSWFRWQLERLRRGELQVSHGTILLLPVLIGWLGWRLRRLLEPPRQRDDPAQYLANSALLADLFAHLKRQGYHPKRGETTRNFLLKASPPQWRPTLPTLLAAYYALRFGATSNHVKLQNEVRRAVDEIKSASGVLNKTSKK